MKAMVLFSGGIDSTTCLGMAVEKYGPENVIALSIAYGQKHTKEIEASDKIVKYYNVEHIYLDLAKIFQYSDCSLLSHSDKEIPKESYDEQIKVVAPFINATKDQVVKKGLELNVPYKYTWSCYEGSEKPCGKCGTCIDRARAFELNGINDPAME